MADSVLLFGWGVPIPGRETKALQVFGEAVEYFARLERDGRIEAWSRCCWKSTVAISAAFS